MHATIFLFLRMKHIGLRLLVIAFLAIASFVYVFPWNVVGVTLPVTIPEYKLGLDLNGGVELDYKVDFDHASSTGGVASQATILEGLKSIIEKRVNSLGTAEPTIETAKYGPGEYHIIVQIPTQNFSRENLTDAEKKARNDEYIARAKETIGKVVRLECKEKKGEITDADRAERRSIADAALKEVRDGTLAFDVVGKKYQDLYENVSYTSGSGSRSEMPPELSFTGMGIVQAPYTSDVFASSKGMTLALGKDNQVESVPGDAGYSIVHITGVHTEERTRDVPDSTGATASAAPALTATSSSGVSISLDGTAQTSSGKSVSLSGSQTGSTKTHKEKYTETVYTYQGIFVSQKPSDWMPAKTANGKTLSEAYLSNASVSFGQTLEAQVDLNFNSEGGAIFGELTKRLVGKQIAIFVGGQMLTAPTVETAIPDGKAVIHGNFTTDSAKKLAGDINTGIVPAPIYLTSERSIDAKIGRDSLQVVTVAGLIGLALIIVFLVAIYRVSGLLAGLALILYGLLLLAIVRFFGIVLTLASIAGIILSIGLAIDANILIFERMKEEFRRKTQHSKALVIGFTKSWSAIWDSHLTSFTSAVVLYIFGINLIKGFGLMLGIGIALSLFTAMYVSRILIFSVGRSLVSNHRAFIGLKEEKGEK